MARRHSTFRRGSGQRRSTSWLDIPLGIVNVGAGGASIFASLSVAELAKRPFTIVRTHLEVKFGSDQAIATESQLGAIGLCVVSDQAAAIGITAVPTPDTDLSSDLWFLNQVVFNDFLFFSQAGFEDNAGRRYSIDSKAMRKVNDDQDVLVVVEATGGSDGTQFFVGGRILIKEH